MSETPADARSAEHTEPAESQPVLKVLTPSATPEEVAAVVAVFAAMGSSTPAPEKQRSEWASPARRMRKPHVHYRGAWQASAHGLR
jgi:hypothetical protein